jgi:hypothetical protein
MRSRWAVIFPICVLAAACGGSTTPTGPSAVPLVTPRTVTIKVSGTVRDAQTSAPIPGVQVQIASGPDITRSTTTDASGNYSLTGVKVGIFTLRFTQSGFEIAERSVNANQDARLDVQLRSGASCMAPPAPTGFRAVVSGTRVTFSWNAAPSATSYLIVAGTSPGSSNTLSFSTTQTTYQWRGAAKGTQFARVFARSDCTHDTPSNEITFIVN